MYTLRVVRKYEGTFESTFEGTLVRKYFRKYEQVRKYNVVLYLESTKVLSKVQVVRCTLRYFRTSEVTVRVVRKYFRPYQKFIIIHVNIYCSCCM